MKTLQKRIHAHTRLTQTVGIILSASITSTLAAPGILSDQPLFTTNAIKPNIALILDDSGSMDSEVLFETNDGALWWYTTDQSFVGRDEDDLVSAGTINYNKAGSSSGTWKKYTYLFPNGSGGTTSAKRIYGDSTNDHFAVPPTNRYAWVRSPDFNSAYFDPATDYSKWVDNGNYTFGDINSTGTSTIVDSSGGSPVTTSVGVTAAPSDPIYNPGTENFNLTADRKLNGANETFKMFSGMVIPAGTEFYCTGGTPAECNSTWRTEAGDINITTTVDVGITFYPATFCLTAGSALPAGYGWTGATINGYNKEGNDPAGMDCYEIKNANFGNATEYKAAINNFGNWFTYYRKRHLAMRAGMSSAFNGLSGAYAEVVSLNASSVTLSMDDLDNAANRTSFFDSIFTRVGSGGTPTRRALDLVGNAYDTDASVVTNSCQKNYAMIFTDGFANSTGPNTNPGNFDGASPYSPYGSTTGLAPYADTYSNTLADIAAKYYSRIRDPGLTAGDVPVNSACENIDITTTATATDCNDAPHINTYAVTLGVKGNIFGVTHNSVADAYTTSPDWTIPGDPSDAANARSRTQVDDLYHATINGHGEIFNASNPVSIAASVESALTSITDEVGAASAIALNTTELNNTTTLYQAKFNSQYWSGEMLAKDIDENDGTVADTATWDAGAQIPTATNRTILSFNPATTHTDGTGVGVKFRAVTSGGAASLADLSNSILPANAISDLGTSLPSGTPCSGAACTATDMLEYLRGDRTDESATAFRERDADTVLGDIVHSTPVFVGEPQLGWPDGDATNGFPVADNDDSTPFNGSYAEFISGYPRTGDEVVYFGANDGMLHGVNASTGAERLAYIPHALFSSTANEGLHYLSQQSYAHHYYVDNEPTISDVFIKNRTSTGTIETSRQWRTVLLGSLRGGGKGIFALDITNPDDFLEANAKQLVLWEFDSGDDAQIGYTFSKPTIVPTNITVNDGGTEHVRWAAIFGNGYNNSGNCHAELFIVFLDGGMDGTWTLDDTAYETTDYLRIDTGVGTAGDCNGLSTPAVVDLNADGKADRIYAGDLKGNMWAFDICNEDNNGDCQETGWGSSYINGSNPEPLFSATDANGNPQPITTKPLVVRHPTLTTDADNAPNTLILFGTGQYLVSGDLSDTTVGHSYYGIWDAGTSAITLDRAANPASKIILQEQTISAYDLQGSDGINDTRVLTDNTFTYSESGTKKFGWYIDLPDSSAANERVIVNSIIRGDQLFFNTAIPTTDGCDVGGYSWLMNVKIENGGQITAAAFDVNGDGVIDDNDMIDTDGDGVKDAYAGGSRQEGLSSSSTFAGDQRLCQTSKGEICNDEIEVTGVDNIGRYSWQELRND